MCICVEEGRRGRRVVFFKKNDYQHVCVRARVSVCLPVFVFVLYILFRLHTRIEVTEVNNAVVAHVYSRHYLCAACSSFTSTHARTHVYARVRPHVIGSPGLLV